MASGKKLGQLLLEQQEPFILDVYLLEKGYLKNRPNSTSKFRNGSDNSSNFLKRLAIYGINRRKKVIPRCSELVKAFFNTSLMTKTGKNSRGLAVAVEGQMSSTSSPDSCSESETRSPQQKQQIKTQIDTEKKSQRGCMEDDKQQLSPISVLDDTFSNQDSTIYEDNSEKQRVKKMRKIERSTVVCNMDTTMKKANETIFSVTLSKLLEQSSAEKPNFSADYIKIKYALRETKQLLFDCVKEVIDTYRRKGKQQQEQHVKEFLGAEEIGKILHDNVIEWSKQATSGTNTRRLLNIDLMASFKEEFDNLQQQRKEISVVIGDLISDDLIFEIVAEMVSRPLLAPTWIRNSARDW